MIAADGMNVIIRRGFQRLRIMRDVKLDFYSFTSLCCYTKDS